MKTTSRLRRCITISVAGLAICTAALGQTCYPTSIVDSSKKTTTTITYDNQNNIASVSVTMGQFSMTYTATTEKTPTGYKKVFTAKDDGSPMMAYVLTKMTLTYSAANRLQLIEAGNNHGMNGTEKFVYNSNNQLAQIDQNTNYTDPSGKVQADRGQIIFSYPSAASKNPSEIKELGIVNGKPVLEVIQHYVLTYGDGKAMSDEFPFSSGPFRTFAANNVATVNITHNNDTVKQTYTYTFNEKGFPTSKTYQFSGDNTTDNYAYTCK